MGKAIQIRVDENLASLLQRIQLEVAESFKKQYGLSEVKIYGTIASQIAAAKLKGCSILNFRIKKNGRNSGVLELM